MSSEPLSRLYDLALAALSDQQQRIHELRSNLAPLIAAGGIGLTLLFPPAIHGSHPDGAAQITAVIAGVAGAVVLVLASAYVLTPVKGMAFTVSAAAVVAALEEGQAARLVEDPDAFYLTMIATLTQRHDANHHAVGHRVNVYSLALAGLLAELAGLGLAAALAS